jgi:hypothetical protein
MGLDSLYVKCDVPSMGRMVSVAKHSFYSFRQLLLLVAATFFLTPVTAYTDNPYLAPAFFVSLYEGLIANGDVGFQRGAAPILAFTVFGLIGYGLIRLLLWRYKPASKDETKEP